MPRSLRRVLVDAAGRLSRHREELGAAVRERKKLEHRIDRLEAEVAKAEDQLAVALERLLQPRAAAKGGPSASEALAPGKLPARLVDHMSRSAEQIHTAPALAAALGVGDVQQVRTTLARLVDAGYVQRTGARGQYVLI